MSDQKQCESQPELKSEASVEADRIVKTIAYRKTCDVEGTGLSHYILMDKRTD